jgi:uncharacterized glyoxalase superfamily protein PhnB
MPTTVLPRPAGFHTVTPYLMVDNARKLIEFAQKAFDAKLSYIHDTPSGAVMHAQIIIGDSIVWLADARPEWPARPASLYLYIDDCDATYARAVAAGGVSIMAPADQFYGDRHGGVDYGGIQWWVATHIEDVSEEEVTRRQKELVAKKK